MTEKPAAQTIRSVGWVAALVAVLAALGYVYFPLLRYCFGKWLEPDYAHGTPLDAATSLAAAIVALIVIKRPLSGPRARVALAMGEPDC